MKYGKRVVLFSLFIMNLVEEPAPLITIKQGILSGITSRCGTFFEYNGIPYAKSDKNTRFQAPGPPPSWEGVYKAIEGYHMCPQATLFGIMGSEDCLKLNIYVPVNIKNEKPLAVMVYIYGGAFVFGSSGKMVYGPRFLLKKDVILVTFNYRVSILGFLCLRTKDAPGNAGIKDQIAALRWVKKNIASFGGDSDNITIFGQSAGAVSLSMLIASEATNGLFKKAIVQSGSSVSNWSINRKPVWIASLLAKSIGFDSDDPKELYNIFSKMDYKDLIAIKAKKPMEIFYDTGLVHLPCVEKYIPGIEPVITDLPYKAFENKPKDIDVVYGVASNEGIFIAPTESEEMLKSRNGRYLFASDLQFSSEKEAMMVAKKVHKFYFGDDEISSKKIYNVSKLYSQLYFEVPALFESEYLLSNNKSKVYNYFFNYHGWRNILKLTTGLWNEDGATHGDDLFYLFDGDLFPPAFNDGDRKMIDQMTSLWTNFAKYGNPTPEKSDLPFKWKSSSKNDLQFLYIDRDPKMRPMPCPECYQLWKDIYSKYRRTDVA